MLLTSEFQGIIDSLDDDLLAYLFGIDRDGELL